MTRFTSAGLLPTILLIAALPAAAEMTQTITLNPGWNAIYVEVVPDDRDIEAIFEDIAIESVWRYLSVDGVAGLPADPADGLQGLEGWRAYFPPGSPAESQSDLFTIRPNNAYLVHLGGAQAATLSLTGQPQLDQRRWSPDAFTLTGFNVDPAGPPTFDTYFAPSTAHVSPPIYSLGANGFWRLADESEAIVPNAAYWVFTTGPSTYQGPLELRIDDGFRDLDFNELLDGTGATLVNRATNAQEILLTRFPQSTELPLVVREIDARLSLTVDGGPPWRPLQEKFPLSLDAGGSERFEVAPRRSVMPSGRLEEVLVFTSTDGVRVLVPAGVSRSGPASAQKGVPGQSVLSPGLWFGTAEINEVNLVQSTSDTASLRSTAQTMRLRLILHVNANLEPTLLSQVVQLFESGLNDSNGDVCANGRPVLITRPERFGDYQGLSLRRDDFVGSRLSTVAYDFGEKPDVDQVVRKIYEQQMVSVGPNQYSVTITHASDSASNPFFHPFHPDHDNLDPNGFPPDPGDPPEVPVLVRELTLQFCPDSDLVDACAPGDEADAGRVLRGTFIDRVTQGLHDRPVIARGGFQFNRIVADPELNPAPLGCP